MIQPPPQTLTPIETHKPQQTNDIPQTSSSSSQSAQQTPSQAYSFQMEQPQQMQQTAGQIPPDIHRSKRNSRVNHNFKVTSISGINNLRHLKHQVTAKHLHHRTSTIKTVMTFGMLFR